MAPLAAGLPCHASRYGCSAHDVLAVGDRLKVVRVDASRSTAEMIECFAEGQGAHEMLIGPPVREDDLAFKPELPVALVVERGCPEPTVANIYLGEEPFGCGGLWVRVV